MGTRIDSALARLGVVALVFGLAGCGGPSDREIQNARAFEALLTAVSLENAKELEADARLLETRHDAGEMTDRNFGTIREIIEKARAKHWADAEKQAYDFREKCGDQGAYFR